MREEVLELNVFHTHPNGCRVEQAEKTLKNMAFADGIKWCMPYKLVNSHGFWLYPPCDIEIVWHGGRDFTYKFLSEYSADEYANIASLLRAVDIKDLEKWCSFEKGRTKFTFGEVEEGVVQMYTGCIFQTNPNWCMQIRSPVNFPIRSQVSVMEAILETDWLQYDIWINLVFSQQKKPLILRRDDYIPIAQLVPIHRKSFTATWQLSTSSIGTETPNKSKIFNFYKNYNKLKFANDGKNNLGMYTLKDSTTYIKVKKEHLNKDGSCKIQKLESARTRKIFNNKKLNKD